MWRAVELGEPTPCFVGDLSVPLVYMKRADEAAVLPRYVGTRCENSPMLAWTWAMLGLQPRSPCRGTRPSEGAANAGFKPGHASPIAAEATREQGKSKRPTNTKSGRELEWTRDETPIV